MDGAERDGEETTKELQSEEVDSVWQRMTESWRETAEVEESTSSEDHTQTGLTEQNLRSGRTGW